MNTKDANPLPCTPGPWAVTTVGSCHAIHPAASHNERDDICRITPHNYHPNGLLAAKSEAAANALLIAAAPELHDLARAARDYLSGIPETAAGGDDAAVRLTRDLDAILARIGGAA